jgi:hypothetical protein
MRDFWKNQNHFHYFFWGQKFQTDGGEGHPFFAAGRDNEAFDRNETKVRFEVRITYMEFTLLKEILLARWILKKASARILSFERARCSHRGVQGVALLRS